MQLVEQKTNMKNKELLESVLPKPKSLDEISSVPITSLYTNLI
jgi:orotate phosphoribosyltransferase-like protein